MGNYSEQHDPRISGADFEDNDTPMCPKCGEYLDPYDERMDGYWCASCLKWYAYFSGGFLSFNEIERIKDREWHPGKPGVWGHIGYDGGPGPGPGE